MRGGNHFPLGWFTSPPWAPFGAPRSADTFLMSVRRPADVRVRNVRENPERCLLRGNALRVLRKISPLGHPEDVAIAERLQDFQTWLSFSYNTIVKHNCAADTVLHTLEYHNSF